MRYVYYLCRRPGTTGQLVFPDETEESYYTLGSFFLSGPKSSYVDDSYAFRAYRNEVATDVELARINNDAFLADVKDVGQFIFDAKHVGVPATYSGRYALPDGGNLIRQLAPRSRKQLEEAALKYNFIFVGYSPNIEGDGSPYPPKARDPGPVVDGENANKVGIISKY